MTPEEKIEKAREEHRVRQRAYRARHKDRLREIESERSKSYRAANLEKCREASRARTRAYIERQKASNPEKYREQKRANNLAWKEKNKDRVRELARDRQRSVRAENPDEYRKKCNERSLKYRDNNPDKIRERNRSVIERLSAGYVALLLRLPLKKVPPDLLESKREQILTLRCIKQLEKTLKEKKP